MTSKLPTILAATGQMSNMPGVRINGENNLPAIPTEVGSTLEHLEKIREYLASLVNSTRRIQDYEFQAIANQLRVAGLPEATVFQEIAGAFHQNYARERKAAEKTVKESAEISRGYARGLGRKVDDVPDSQIHGKNYADIAGDLERNVADMLIKTLSYARALTDTRLHEIEGQARGMSGAYRSTNMLNSRNENDDR